MIRLNQNHQNKYFSLKLFSAFIGGLIFFLLAFSQNLTVAQNLENNNINTKQRVKSNGVGKFILQYENSSNIDLRDGLIETRMFDSIVNELNSSGLVIRQNIPVIFKDCEQPNAFWDPDNQNMIMCYELISFGFQLFNKKANYSEQEAISKSLNNSVFTFYHELGHALIDILDLSAVGQEEDTVDEFASVMLYKKFNNESAAQILLDSSAFYEILYKMGARGSGWDEHAPNDKRLFNLVCFVYGSNPNAYKQVFEEKFNLLNHEGTATQSDIDSRAYKCQQEYAQKVDSWNRLLLPHYATRNQNQPASNSPSNHNSPNGVSRKGTYW